MLTKNLPDHKVVLRPLKNGDEILFYEWRNDLEYIKNTKSIRLPKTQGLEKEWVDSNMSDKSNKNVIFIISVDGSDIGFVQLTSIDWISKNCYLGISICKNELKGLGIATEAERILLEYAFKNLGLHKVCLEVTEFNTSGIGIQEKLGFVKEGTMKEQYFWDDKYHDVHIYGLLKTDYLKAHEK